MKTTRFPRSHLQSCFEPDDEPAADVVESLLLVLLGLPLMAGFALAAVRLTPWLLSHGMSFAALVAICVASGLAGASLFGLLAMACRRAAQAWSRLRRAE
jgi:hypothetical protein